MISSAVHAKVAGFIDDVLSGQIVVGKLITLAVRRHIEDLDRADQPGFPYYFDPIAASASCEFYPLVMRHTIGDYAGLPFEIEPWQAFFCWSLFGWKRTSDGSRRFRKFFMSVARKNGKSTFAAGLAILLASCDFNPTTGTAEQVAEVILCATKKEQAEKVIYAEIDRMRTNSVWLTKKSTRINNQITFTANQGSIRCVGSDKPYDGLNPHAIIMDELHAWKEHHRKFYDTMQTGSGARRQPVIGTVTTAGDDKSHLYIEEYNYAANVLNKIFTDETLLAYPWEIDTDDDPLREDVWPKANPNLGISVKLEYLREQALLARSSSISLNRFTRYHSNRQVTSVEKVFDLEQWDACSGKLSDWATADCVCAGFDLGGYDDLAAYGLVARFVVDSAIDNPVYRYECKVFAFISEKTERDLTKYPFSTYIYDGYLTKCTHPNSDLQADLIDKMNQYRADKVAFDPSGGRSIAEELTKCGFIAASMGQNFTNFNEPIHDLLAVIREGRFTHDGNPLLRWSMNNAMCIRDRQDRWMYDKRDSADKIDPIVAMTMAFRLATLEPARATGNLFLI